MGLEQIKLLDSLAFPLLAESKRLQMTALDPKRSFPDCYAGSYFEP